MTENTALALEDLHKSFGATAIIRGVSLDIRAGSCHAIIGPNGAGKSTLFHLITGRLKLDRGRIRLAGHDITGLSPHRVFRQGLARSFQVTSLFPRLSVFENLRVAAMWQARCGHAYWRSVAGYPGLHGRVLDMLENLHLTPRRDVPAAALAYAEQRTLEIGLALIGGAHTILLDEPTAGMSRAETERAVALLRRLAGGRTLVLIEHDLSVVFDLADIISVLAEGQVIASGPPQSVRGDAAVRAAYLGTAAEDLA